MRKGDKGDDSLIFIFAYAPPTVHRRGRFWVAVKSEIEATSGPVFLDGDMNCILRLDERQGGSGLLHNDSPTYKSLVEDYGLVDLGFYGQNFTRLSGTRPGNYVAKRLDRVLMCTDAFARWPNAFVRHLPKFCSDHCPLLFNLKPMGRVDRSRIPFRFKVIWDSHPEFKDLIRNSWNSEVPANEALVALIWKLIKWNQIVFGNVNDKKARLVALLDKLQTDIHLSPSDALLRRESEVQVELADKQKSRKCWLWDGDRNTSFFHLSTIIRRKRTQVKALKDDGDTWVYDPVALERLVVDFCRELYSIPQHELFPIIHARLSGWRAKHFSFAGKVTLAKSMLNSIPIYSMATLPLSVSTRNHIDSLTKTFIWGEHTRKMHMVGWLEVSRPKECGGLEIKRMEEFNLALNENWLGGSFIAGMILGLGLSDPSPIWRAIKKGVNEVVCRGSVDHWVMVRRLLDWVITDVGTREREVRHLFANILLSEVLLQIASCSMVGSDDNPDALAWSATQDVNYSVAMATRSSTLKVLNPPKIGLFMRERAIYFCWMAIKGAVLTKFERMRRDLASGDECPRCSGKTETFLHVLRDYHYARHVWRDLDPGLDLVEFFSLNYAQWMATNIAFKGTLRHLWSETFATTLWTIWKWRNKWIFDRVYFEGSKSGFIKVQVEDYVKAVRKREKGEDSSRHMVDIAWLPPP
ncbi:LOW QUALITY PROTEIN: hypothetical protein V2J09_022876 [Rumex salicifolius]